jgi:hypothetical protein
MMISDVCAVQSLRREAGVVARILSDGITDGPWCFEGRHLVALSIYLLIRHVESRERHLPRLLVLWRATCNYTNTVRSTTF